MRNQPILIVILTALLFIGILVIPNVFENTAKKIAYIFLSVAMVSLAAIIVIRAKRKIK